MKKNDVKDIQIKIRKMRKKSGIGNKGVGRGCRQSTVPSHSPRGFVSSPGWQKKVASLVRTFDTSYL